MITPKICTRAGASPEEAIAVGGWVSAIQTTKPGRVCSRAMNLKQSRAFSCSARALQGAEKAAGPGRDAGRSRGAGRVRGLMQLEDGCGV